ncbi:MAG: LamB/YcsF family protein [Clostridiales bacterium]|nr:LamB/YcsF family protein [Clostridiales bacterium]
MKLIDLNCDMGENRGDDNAVIKYISSANIACGGHAGDNDTIKKTILLAKLNNVRAGAHPGYPDRENFGRYEIGMENMAVCDEVLTQIFRFKEITDFEGGKINHIKFHGALYNRAAQDYNLMYMLVEKIYSEFCKIPIFTLAGSLSEKAVTDAGGIYLKEGFADRAYDDFGNLVSREIANAVLHDIGQISSRVLGLVKSGSIKSINNNTIHLKVDSICVHGDSPGAILMIKEINKIFIDNDISIGRRDEV